MYFDTPSANRPSTMANDPMSGGISGGSERYRKSQSGRDHVRRSDGPPGYSVFRLSRHAMVFWRAMGVERSLAQYGICRRRPAMSFSDIVLGCVRGLWAGRDSHLCAGADLDCFGIADGHFGVARSLQTRADFRKTATALRATTPPTPGIADEVMG
jgi:hypothetical protein